VCRLSLSGILGALVYKSALESLNLETPPCLLRSSQTSYCLLSAGNLVPYEAMTFHRYFFLPSAEHPKICSKFCSGRAVFTVEQVVHCTILSGTIPITIGSN
jgi:hypothetical protein